MNIAITGATGFVGKYVVEHFQNKGFDVIALGRNLDKLDKAFDDSIIKKETDFSFSSLLNVLKDVDAIVHLAAKRFQKDQDPLIIEPYINDNIILTQNILKAAQELNISRVCQTSSIGVYSGKNILPFQELEAPQSITIYGVSKLTCENLGNLFSAKTKVRVTNLRLASLCGIGEKEGVIFTDYLRLALHKKTLGIWGKGETSIDFLYVRDAVSAIEKALLPDSPYGTYNIGSGRAYSVKEIAESINDVFDNEGNLAFFPDKPEGGYKVFMNNYKAEKELGWKPDYTFYEALFDMKSIIG